jgi:hypothetical protein
MEPHPFDAGDGGGRRKPKSMYFSGSKKICAEENPNRCTSRDPRKFVQKKITERRRSTTAKWI